MTKFSFTIIIFISWIMLSVASNNISLKFPNYMNDSLEHLCKNETISINFSKGMISMDEDFISSPLITCLDFTGTHIQSIKNGAFNKLPNLIQLIFSDNMMNFDELFGFGDHENLKILILNGATNNSLLPYTIISGQYPNLEILSARKNSIIDLKTLSMSLTTVSYPEFYIQDTSRTVKTDEYNSPFPKLKVLDLSSNNIQSTNFMKLLPESLYFLDLHDNLLNSFAFNKKQVNLLALNLNNNNLKHVQKSNDLSYSSSTYNPYNTNRNARIYNRHYDYYYDLGRYDNQYDSHNSHNFDLVMANLENLHYLSISGNKIDFIEPNAFEDTDKLVYLNLSINNINYLHPEIFKNLQSLRLLDLSFNKLEDIPQISSQALNILSLNCNNIKYLNLNSFIEMPNLTKLLLAHNQIDKFFNISTFYNAHLLLQLEILDLSSNKLSFLPKILTESFTSLKYLNLNDNKFTSLESLSLTNVLPLMEVHLAMNPLEYLDVSYFKNLPQNLTVNLMQKSNFVHWNFYKCEQE